MKFLKKVKQYFDNLCVFLNEGKIQINLLMKYIKTRTRVSDSNHSTNTYSFESSVKIQDFQTS